MEQTITKQMIEQGYKQGIIKLTTEEEYCGNISANDEYEGVICQIGEYWFWFGGEKAEEYTAKEYKNNIPEETIIDEIFDTLSAFSEDLDTFEDEYLYYYYFLKENISTED